MNKHLGPVLAVVATLGVVGGVAGAHAFQPVTREPAKVQLVQPAAQTVTPSPTTTSDAAAKAAAAAKAKAAALAKKKAAAAAAKKAAAKRAAVAATQQKSSTQQRQAIVSEQPAEPQPSKPAPFGTAPNGLPKPPPVDWGSQDPPPTSTN